MNHGMKLFYERSLAFAPLALCTAERKRYEPLLQTAENSKGPLGVWQRGWFERVIAASSSSYPSFLNDFCSLAARDHK